MVFGLLEQLVVRSDRNGFLRVRDKFAQVENRVKLVDPNAVHGHHLMLHKLRLAAGERS